jgi:DNA anti-recombination protein RmuC
MNAEELHQINEMLLAKIEEMRLAHTKEVNTLASEKFDKISRDSLIALGDAFGKLTHEYLLGSERLDSVLKQLEKLEQRNERLANLEKLEEELSETNGNLKAILKMLEKIVEKMTKTPPTSPSVI